MSLLHSRFDLVDHSVAALALADGDVTLAALTTGLGIEGVHELVQLGKDDRRYNKCEVEFCGVLADNTSKNVAVFAGRYIYSATSPGEIVGASLVKLVTATATIGTKTGIAGADADATHRFADTLASVTETAAYVDLKTASGAGDIREHSPADNTVARLYIPETGFADFLAVEAETGLKARVRVGA